MNSPSTLLLPRKPQLILPKGNSQPSADLTALEAELKRRLLENSKERCKRLVGFIKESWAVLEPGRTYVHNWHIDAIAEHLEAVSSGDITRLLINIPPSSGKPVSCDEQIFTNKGFVPLRAIRVGDEVLTHRGRFRPVTAIHEQGILPQVEIKTFAGRTLRTAPDHPFLTTRGWIAAGDLQATDYLGLPVPEQDWGTGEISPEEARLLGYFVGDGALSQSSVGFTNCETEILDDFEHCVRAMGFHSKRKNHSNPSNPLQTWLESHGLWRSNSYTKFIPAAVFRSGKVALANFLGAYWSCDGTISLKDHGSGNTLSVDCSACTVSKQLALDVLQALTLLGIEARLREKLADINTASQGDAGYLSYIISASKQNEIPKIGALPGLVSRKRDYASVVKRSEFDRNLISDGVLSVKAVSTGECRCLTVEEDSSFTVGLTAVHNSLIIGVFWPAWEWTFNPAKQYLTSSFAETHTKRDCRKMRDLIGSDWYRERWPKAAELVEDTILKFSNASKGYREGRPFSGLIGGKGDTVILDDPHSNVTAESPTQRNDEVTLFRESVTYRLNDQVRGSIIVVMQRLHQDDISGVIIRDMPQYVHLMLPMRFEPERKCKTRIGFEDPRTKLGELLFPARFPEEQVALDEESMQTYACNPGEASVLMRDLTLRRIDEVCVGDEVVGWAFDDLPKGDDRGHTRKYLKTAEVLHVQASVKPVVKVTLDSGEVIRCTADHRWYKRQRPRGKVGDQNSDMEYSPAKVGSYLCRVCPTTLPTLTVEQERIAGWVAGFFDGEGSVSLGHRRESDRPSVGVAFYQTSERNLPLCTKLEESLGALGFSYRVYEKQPRPGWQKSRAYKLAGSKLLTLQRFLHVVQPVKWRQRIIDNALTGNFIQGRERVVSIESDGEDTVYSLTTTTGNYVVWGFASSNCAAQLQQRPSPRGGGMFKRAWFGIVGEAPKGGKVLRRWDLAATEKVGKGDPDWTVGLKIRRGPDGKTFYIEDMVRFRGSAGDVEKELLRTAQLDTQGVTISLAQDPGSAGKAYARTLITMLAGYIVTAKPETGSKEMRAAPLAAQCEVGNVKLVKGHWNEEFLKEFETFPTGRHDDIVDAASAGFSELALAKNLQGTYIGKF